MEGLFPEQRYPRYFSRKYGLSVVRETPREQGPLWVPLSLQAQQTFIYKHLLPHLHVNFLSSPRSPKRLPSTTSFVFS